MPDAADAASGAVERDPRVERSRRVILEAVLAELGEVGYGGMTIEGVAARAGVGKSTIYRYWPGKLELVEDAFRTVKAEFAVPPQGSIRERVLSILEQITDLLADSTYSSCMPALIEASERDPTVRDFHCRFSAERRAVLVSLLGSAVASGELEAGTDPAILADALVGPILMRRLMLGLPITRAMATDLVDQLLPLTAKSAG